MRAKGSESDMLLMFEGWMVRVWWMFARVDGVFVHE